MSEEPLQIDPPFDSLAAPRRRDWSAAVHIAVGLLLVAAAILKGYQAGTSLPGIPLRLRLMDLALIEFELLLGGMLLLNRWRRAAWALTIVTFTVFAGVSLNKALAGAPSCGCFGAVTVNPKLMVALDTLVVILLVFAGPRPIRTAARPRLRRVGAVAILALMCAAVGGVAFAAVPKRGLEADNANFDFGALYPYQAKVCAHTFTVRNTSDRPIRILASPSSCSCTVSQAPTAPIPPGQSAEVRLRADWSKIVGNPYAQVTLETDSRWTPKVPLVIHAQIRPHDE